MEGRDLGVLMKEGGCWSPLGGFNGGGAWEGLLMGEKDGVLMKGGGSGSRGGSNHR